MSKINDFEFAILDDRSIEQREGKRLSPEEIKEMHGKKVKPAMRDIVLRSLPDDMHIDKRGVLRYLLGQAPGTKAAIAVFSKTQPAGYKKGESGNTGRKRMTKKYLRYCYLQMLKQKGENGKESIAEEFAEKHIQVIRDSFRSKKFTDFSRFIADFASIAGELEKESSDSVPTILQPVFILPPQRAPEPAVTLIDDVEYKEIPATSSTPNRQQCPPESE